MVENRRAVRISKYLSLVLRHEPSAADLTLDAEGWADIAELLGGAARRGFPFSRPELDEVEDLAKKVSGTFGGDQQNPSESGPWPRTSSYRRANARSLTIRTASS